MRPRSRDGDRRRCPPSGSSTSTRSGRHLLGLINDVLDLAKVEAGRLDLRLEPLRAGHRGRRESARPACARSPTASSSTGHGDAARRRPSLADRGRLRQIVYNLLSNAIKFTPDGGAIAVAARRRRRRRRASRVTDTGVGHRRRRPGAGLRGVPQVGDPTAREAGTGLGLALTARLVEAHGGADRADVGARAGAARFTVRACPTADAGGPPPTGGGARATGARGSTVLVIEDDPRRRAAAAHLPRRRRLPGRGGRATARPGSPRPRANPPAAIVLDVLLPGIDGWEVLRRLKADAAARATCRSSSSRSSTSASVGLALGAVDYFVKPVDQAALLGALARDDRRPARARGCWWSTTTTRSAQAIEDGLRAGRRRRGGLRRRPGGAGAEPRGHFDLIVCDMQIAGRGRLQPAGRRSSRTRPPGTRRCWA